MELLKEPQIWELFVARLIRKRHGIRLLKKLNLGMHHYMCYERKGQDAKEKGNEVVSMASRTT